MNVLAFALGLISLGLVKADVSHLRQNQHFVANNGQLVRQSYNSRGDATFSSSSYNAGNNPNSNSRYWWMSTETLPFKTTHDSEPKNNNYFSAAGCNGCASRTLNIIRHNTPQHATQNNAYSQNPFTNVKHRPSPSFNGIHRTASVSGSPFGANTFVSSGQKFESGRIQQSTPCSDSGSACVAPKLCLSGFIDQSAEHKAVRSASGKCYAPEVCCRFAQRRSAAYNQDNTVSAAEFSTSEILTKEGYVVKKPSNQYLPSFDDAPTNNQGTYIRPQTQRPPQPPPRTQPPRPQPIPTRPPQPTPPRFVPTQPPRPYQPQPSEIRPVQYDPAPVVIPVGCSAAMNCTSIQYCTAAGVISKSPVTLTPQQELFRVPLTDCREPNTQQVGKCCRDPDYTDPWPVGRTGQYVAEELNQVFDNGAYKPEPSAQQPVRVRVQQEGYVLPQPSNNQQRLYLPPKSNRI